MQTLAPTARPDRIAGIDIARGFALLGIILVNARFFFLPFGSAINPARLPDGLARTPLDWAVHDAIDAVVTFKFISLFSLLFGFGVATQAGKAAAAGVSRWPGGLRRLGALLCIGLVHGFLVWDGDILALYSVLGTLVLAFAGLGDRWLRRVTIGVLAVLLLLTFAGAGLKWAFSDVAAAASAEAAAKTTVDPESPPRGFAALMAASFDPGSSTWMNAEVAAIREGPWLDAFAFRATGYVIAMVAAPFSYGWQSLLMMMLGVWAYRTGLFAAEGGALRRKLAIRGLAVGLPLALCTVLPRWLLGRESAGAEALSTIAAGLASIALPVAYACLAVEFGPRLPALIVAPVRAAGSIALTVYLSESILCTAIASWWGLARFGTMLDAEFSSIVLAVWAMLALGALAWVRAFGAGPMERLWRAITYRA
jgi:uncharacterized protein